MTLAEVGYPSGSQCARIGRGADYSRVPPRLQEFVILYQMQVMISESSGGAIRAGVLPWASKTIPYRAIKLRGQEKRQWSRSLRSSCGLGSKGRTSRNMR